MYSATDVIWVLVSAVLVFFMQAGFALCEAGLTRAKNTGNILMKNMMDFCIGVPCFWLIGFGIMFAGSGPFIGGFDPLIRGSYDFGTLPTWCYAIFQTVFCATAATIVSGSMAERTNFKAYCIYSAAGPRIGKYGKDGKPRAIPGHNLTAMALGVFILWFCWFGFNGGSTVAMSSDADMELASLVMFNTNLAAATATVAAMILTWIRYGKPDVSMTFNAALAGLVAVTAPCDCISPEGAFFIGLVAGLLVVFSVEFFDKVARIDDPVGAVSVHMVNGIWGTIAVGLFSTGGNGVGAGLFYGGGFDQLLTQLLGVVSVAAYVLVIMLIIFKLINATVGLRVPAKVEIDGLDIHEHGLASAYSGFAISDVTGLNMEANENTDLGEDSYDKASEEQKAAAVKVSARKTIVDGVYDTGMHKVSIICRLSRFDALKNALNTLGVTGITMTQVMGCGLQKGAGEKYRGVEVDVNLIPKVKVEVVVSKIPVDSVIEAAKKALYTGHIGDGKIFVYNVTRVVKVRTGEEDYAALQDVE